MYKSSVSVDVHIKPGTEMCVEHYCESGFSAIRIGSPVEGGSVTLFLSGRPIAEIDVLVKCLLEVRDNIVLED
jgi:hypothetical protein